MFNLVNLNAKNVWQTLAVIAVGALAWYLYAKAKAQSAANANAAASDANTYGAGGNVASQLPNLALLGQLFGNQTTAESASQAPTSTTQVTQSAPLAQPGAAPATSGSSTGNTPVTQVTG
jgi:hypothetical protein